MAAIGFVDLALFLILCAQGNFKFYVHKENSVSPNLGRRSAKVMPNAARAEISSAYGFFIAHGQAVVAIFVEFLHELKRPLLSSLGRRSRVREHLAVGDTST
ncbi:MULTISPECIES: hypothetical protein [unclassified Mesorhizobium]|uniref:hypothetical protein n=1 Tax=unclassified Mesorhizobium TaxID=325217 RepID=UPI0012EB54C1|nr:MULTISPECIES: hypothetical protein [unclassified Mesorhizobium]WJI50365.1 hypothetical protein NLY44_28025 [Mesorhizobium sp. C089B]